MALARLYDDYMHLVVRKTSPITSLADLIGRKVSIGAPGSGTVVTADRLLSVGLAGVPGAVQTLQYGLDDSVSGARARTGSTRSSSPVGCRCRRSHRWPRR